MKRRRPWWIEFPGLLAAYYLYEYGFRIFVAGSTPAAARNARRVIAMERAIGLYHEADIQKAFLGHHLFIEFWDIYYGTIHFVMPVVGLIWLWRRFPDRYLRWRNTLAATILFALIGFAAIPLMPPRLLPARYHFVDTEATIGGQGILDQGAMKDVGNQYAAMPSLHIAWSAWCAFAMVPVIRRRWLKVLTAAYPFATLFAVVVTANHYILDGAGGLVALGLGYAAAVGWERADPLGRRRAKALEPKAQVGNGAADQNSPCLTPATGSATTTSPASRPSSSGSAGRPRDG
ncbi:MAG: hypothetical protein QOG64_2942 [Acidimicrobiaceae bacterium]|nr:hypothetical protein [Acidimicrobiaceae bacterium]